MVEKDLKLTVENFAELFATDVTDIDQDLQEKIQAQDFR